MKVPIMKSLSIPAVMAAALGMSNGATAFQAPRVTTLSSRPILTPSATPHLASSPHVKAGTSLKLASEDGGDNTSKRRRRKRKKTTTDTPAATTAETAPPAETPKTENKQQNQPSAKSLAQQLLAQEQMMYDQDEDLTSFIPQKLEEDDRIAAAASKAGFSVNSNNNEGGIASEVEDLFDSREFLQRKREKQLEDQQNANSNINPNTGIPTKKKIKRSDIEAYTRLLEMDPLADEDDSYFEEEDNVDIISALLGDVERGVGTNDAALANRSGEDAKVNAKKKTSFLGIGSGPLQVGHFIGALGVVLMAFVEYPGFPLTNLPDPLRGALQGGLGTIYLINTILAILAAISAPSRRQPSLLWAAKTFAVGGIAYDQLLAIPTPEEMKEMARKEEEKRKIGSRGSRARRNKN